MCKIKRNNPGNIRTAYTRWFGEITEKGEAFCHFRDLSYGCRAMLKLLKRYINEKRWNTIRKVINRWAPPTENNTAVYIEYVSRKMDTHPDDTLQADKETLIGLASAMTFVEHDIEIPRHVWEKAYKLL